MYMLSLNQYAGIAKEELTSLETITAELLNFIQLKNQRLYMHSLQVANYSVSIATKLALPKREIDQNMPPYYMILVYYFYLINCYPNIPI